MKKTTPNQMSDTKVGVLIDDTAQRDAIHIAVAPLKAGQVLQPGQRIGLINGDGVRESAAVPAIGIVDPFLREPVLIGQTFWLFLFPGTITSLRHAWTHPAFVQQMREQDSTAVLSSIAAKIGCSERDLLIRLDLYAKGSSADDDSIHEGLNSLQDEMLINLMWSAYEAVRGKTVEPEIKSSTYFSCAC